MQEAFGGIMNLFLIALFLVLVEGFLALTVNFTKAFRMKNIVISTFEEYEGSGCLGTSSDTACRKRILDRAEALHYAPSALKCPNGTMYDDIFCAEEIDTHKTRSSNGYVAYRITTQLDINIPVVRDILSFEFFQIHGDTRLIQRPRS